MSLWFLDYTKVQRSDPGKPYVISDVGAKRDRTIIQQQVLS